MRIILELVTRMPRTKTIRAKYFMLDRNRQEYIWCDKILPDSDGEPDKPETIPFEDVKSFSVEQDD